MGWFRADVQAQLALLRGLPAADLAQLLTAVNLVRGVEPSGNLGQLVQAVAALRGVNNATLSTLLSQTEFVTQTQLLNVLLTQIRDAIGIPTGDATTTVLGRLAAIERLLMTTAAGLPPILQQDDYTSGAPIVFEGRKYATWPSPPAGTSSAAPFYQLSPASSWDGWQFYIQTNDPAPQWNTTVVAPNFWYDMAGNAAASWSVELQYLITVTLRSPALTLYEWLPSEQSGFNTIYGFRIYPQYSKYPELQYGWIDNVPNSNIELRGNYGGWSVTIDGPVPYYIYTRQGGSYGAVTHTKAMVLPAGTTGVLIFDDSGAKGTITLQGAG
jgi:hypothetical protein